MMDKVSIKASATDKAVTRQTQPKTEAVRPEVKVSVTQTTERWLVIVGGTILGSVSSKKEQAEMIREWRENR